MATIYSSDLKLSIMATGENAGTWGSITNTNLYLIQQAIGGYQEVNIAGGDVVTGSGTGGQITLGGGNADSGPAGGINLVAGDSTSGVAGNINITPGNTTSGTAGKVIQTAASTTIAFTNFQGTLGAASANSLSSSVATAGAKTGAIKVQINGVDAWIRVYATAE